MKWQAEKAIKQAGEEKKKLLKMAVDAPDDASAHAAIRKADAYGALATLLGGQGVNVTQKDAGVAQLEEQAICNR